MFYNVFHSEKRVSFSGVFFPTLNDDQYTVVMHADDGSSSSRVQGGSEGTESTGSPSEGDHNYEIVGKEFFLLQNFAVMIIGLEK